MRWSAVEATNAWSKQPYLSLPSGASRCHAGCTYFLWVTRSVGNSVYATRWRFWLP